MIKAHARMQWNRTEQEILKRLNLESGGAVQQALDAAIVKDSAKYAPFDSGALAQTVRGVGTGNLEYIVPYAHYQYYGELYLAENGSSYAKLGETKFPSGIGLNYNKEKNALAGPFWFERAKADNQDKWLKEAKKAVGK